MSAPKFDAKTFHKRLSQFYEEWKAEKSGSLWNDADVIAIIYGNTDEDRIYRKSSIIQLWLFGYELPDTLIIATEQAFCIYTSSRKIKLLQPLQDAAPEGSIPIEFITREKKATENEATLQKILERIHSSYGGSKIGVLKKDKQEGASVDQWNSVLENETLVDVTKGVSNLLAVKDAQEQKYMRRAATISSSVLEKVLISRVESIIDEEKEVRHSDLAEEIEKKILSGTIVKEPVDRCYTPIIQSGGEYNLKPNAFSSDNVLTFDTIICSLGIRYRNYCSNVARTLIINQTPEQEANYDFLCELQKATIAAIVPGATLSAVYQSIVDYVAEKRPDLSDHLIKNCGFGIGLEYRESSLLVSPKCEAKIKAGMTFNLMLGFENLSLDVKGRPDNYALLLSDVVLVTEQNTVLLTVLNEKKFTYDLDNEEGREKKAAMLQGASSSVLAEIAANTTRQPRAAAVGDKMSDEEKLKLHQRQLQEKQLQERIRKYQQTTQEEEGKSSGNAAKKVDLRAYTSSDQFPPSVSLHRIFVDAENECIILPIYGHMVPFHISTIKTVNKDNDYLRISFLYPSTQANMNQLNHQAVKDADKCTFIRELSFCIPDQSALTNYLHQMKQLLKVVTQKEKMRKQMSELKKQESLKLSKGSVPRLPQVFPRPSPAGKTNGVLEAHKNGLRFFGAKRSKQPVDILYRNVRHAFFQPCTAKEMIVILHFHLYDEIMVGKKKTRDIQFCLEASELSQSLSKASRFGDPDEFEEERRERAMRKKYNEAFRRFAQQVQAQVNNEFEFDIPYTELGFFGVPFKSRVLIQPTADCLVQLVEPPFFVLSLQEIEICCLERVSFQLKQFDAIFVLKNYSKPVVRIDAIPMESLEGIKKWLDQYNIAFFERPDSLQWKRILKSVREDPQGFFEQGGWQDILRPPSDEEEDPADLDDEDFDDDEFAMDDDDEDSLEILSGSDSGSFSGDDEDDDDDEEMDDEESAPDWDELEEEAQQEDMRRKKKRMEKGEDFSDDEDARPRKKMKMKRK